MNKKNIIIFLCIILIFSITLSISGVFKNDVIKSEDTFFIEGKLEEQTLEVLLRQNFETNEYVSVGQLLVFFNRVNGNNVATYEEVKQFAFDNNISLPSDLVYNMTEWETLWRDMMLGKVVFEKTNDNTYAVNLIKGYLTIYLNQQGYELMKQGLIPPQLYLYSPFSSVKDLENINLNKNVTFGMLLDVLMSCEVGSEKEDIIRQNIIEKVIAISGKKESDWTANEVSLYNYYALSYYGEFAYFKYKGYIDNMEFKDIMKPISVGEVLILYEKLANKNS